MSTRWRKSAAGTAQQHGEEGRHFLSTRTGCATCAGSCVFHAAQSVNHACKMLRRLTLLRLSSIIEKPEVHRITAKMTCADSAARERSDCQATSRECYPNASAVTGRSTKTCGKLGMTGNSEASDRGILNG
eukprot:6190994-Pleurochrysis_carterae.AAC.2